MSQNIPPWLAEKIKAFQQTQSNLQNVMVQLQQLEIDRADALNSIGMLKSTPDGKAVYKRAGSIMVQSDRESLVSDLEERLELSKTQTAVLTKQKARLETTMREQEASVNQAIRGGAAKPGS